MAKVTISVDTEVVKAQKVDLVAIGHAIGDMDDERLMALLAGLHSECQDNPKVQAALANLYNVLDEVKESWV